MAVEGGRRRRGRRRAGGMVVMEGMMSGTAAVMTVLIAGIPIDVPRKRRTG